MSTSRPARLPRVPMPLLDSDARRDSFDEVALGYDLDAARAEAARCLHCKRPRCEEGCPVGVLIRDFIAALSVGEVARGVALLKLRNALPAVCGRVCPQETQCEASCVLARKGDAIAIGRLERFLADWDRQLPANQRNATPLAQRKGRRAAIVGSGPASLTCAGELVLRGWDVDLFEGLHMAGGVLAYGIPEFRLPKSILADEIDQLRRRCVEFHFNEIIGKTCSVEDLLQEGYDTAFLGLGAGLPLFLGIPGETHNGVYSANEYLTRVNLMRAWEFPRADTPIRRGNTVLVVGGGNVAVDAARTALRLGATEVTLAYRRTRADMPARAEEITHAVEEGIRIRELLSPLRIEGDEGQVMGMCVRPMRLVLPNPPDSDARPRPEPVPGASEELLPADTVVVAIGTRANPYLKEIADVATNQRGYLMTDKDSRTSNARIFAGGDAVTGAATVIEAMGAGKTAAAAMDKQWG